MASDLLNDAINKMALLGGRREGKSTAFAAAAAALAKMPGYSTDDDLRGAKLRDAMAAPVMIMDELIEKKEVEKMAEASDELKKLVEMMNEYFTINDNPPVTLNQPASLTVKKKDGTFSKSAHIGGEEFKVVGAYLGKRGDVIITFVPYGPTPYAFMEMPIKEARTGMTGFNEVANRACDGDLGAKMKEINKAKADEKEAKANAGKSEQYAEAGWGEW